MRSTIFLVILFWGVWGLAEKIGLRFGTPYETIFAFYIWTALVFLPFSFFMVWKRKEIKISKKVWFWICIAVITDAIAVLSLRFALLGAFTGIVLATIAVYPGLTALFSKWFLKEEISKTQWIGIGLACVGIFVLSI